MQPILDEDRASYYKGGNVKDNKRVKLASKFFFIKTDNKDFPIYNDIKQANNDRQ